MTLLPKLSFNLLRRGRHFASGRKMGWSSLRVKRIHVPSYNNLRWEVMKECHDSNWAGHLGRHCKLALVANFYYWPYLKDEMRPIKTYLVCQQDKIEQGEPVGLLEPFPIPKRLWESVSMDFIAGLRTREGCDWLLVVVDWYFKYATFMLTPKEFSTWKVTNLFFKYMV